MVTWHISNDARRRCEAELETSEIWSSGTSSSGNMYLKHLGDMTHLKWCKKKCCLLSLKHLTPEVLEPHHVKDMAAQLKQDQVERYGCWTKVDQVKEAQSTHFFKPMPMRFQANAGSFPTMQELPNQSNLGIWDFFQIVCICIYIYVFRLEWIYIILGGTSSTAWFRRGPLPLPFAWAYFAPCRFQIIFWRFESCFSVDLIVVN